MRPVFQAVICILALLLSGCELKLKQAKTPPPPQPTMAKAEPPPSLPAAPVEPLSTPQTQVRFPPPQPIDPEAVVPPPPYTVDASAPRPKKKRTGPQAAAAQAKPEPVETAEAPATETAPPRLEPVIPEQQRLQRLEEISARLKEVEKTLAHVKPQNDTQKQIWGQIRSFVDQAYQARDQGDIQKASGLTDLAQLRLQDLTRAR